MPGFQPPAACRYTIFPTFSLLFTSLSAGDSSLLFGEISGSALAGIEAALSRFLKPLLSESDGWGKADTEQKVVIGSLRYWTGATCCPNCSYRGFDVCRRAHGGPHVLHREREVGEKL